MARGFATVKGVNSFVNIFEGWFFIKVRQWRYLWYFIQCLFAYKIISCIEVSIMLHKTIQLLVFIIKENARLGLKGCRLFYFFPHNFFNSLIHFPDVAIV